MIIEQYNKNIFSFPLNYVLTNTVNCVGIMGKGIALEFKKRYPLMFKDYVDACKSKELRIGKCWLWQDLVSSLICFPTKDNWKTPSKYEYIQKGLNSYLELTKNFEYVVVPKLGCGCGGLEWTKVKNILWKPLLESSVKYILV